MSKTTKAVKRDKSKKSLKKLEKSPTKLGNILANSWEEQLERTEINDGKWNCNVAIMAETLLENTRYIQLFQEHAESGRRAVVKCIDYRKDVVIELNQIQNIKGPSGDSHPLAGICKTAAKQMMVDGFLSTEMLVKYLKYKIIRLKEDDIKRRKKLVMIQMHKEQQELLDGDLTHKNETIEKENKNDNKVDKKKTGKDKKRKESGDKTRKESGDKTRKESGDKTRKESGDKTRKESGDKTRKESGDKTRKESGDKKRKESAQKTSDAKGKGKKGKKEEPIEETKREDWWNEEPSEKDKIDTLLKVRGEKGPEIDLADDSPTDGAELYVVLTGFLDPQLLIEFVKQKIPLNCIIQVYGDDLIKRESRAKLVKSSDIGNATCIENPCDNEGTKHLDYKLPDGELNVIKDQEIKNFWNTYNEYVLDKEINLFLRDIALFKYSPAEYIQQNTSSLHSLAQLMYNDISYLMYDIEERAREHIEYIRGMKLLSPEEEKIPINLSDMEIYNTMVQMLPIECASVPFILHCMTEQVDALCRGNARTRSGTTFEKVDSLKKSTVQTTENNRHVSEISVSVDRSSTVPKSKVSKLSEDKENIEKIHTKLSTRLDELDIDYGVSQIPASQVARTEPLVLLYQDEVLLRTYHVAIPEVDLNKITAQILANSPPANLWRLYKRQHGFQKYKFNHHIHKLWRCMEKTNLSLEMLKSYLHLLILEKMECSSANKDNLEKIDNTSRPTNPKGPATGILGNATRNVSPAAYNGIETPFSEPDEKINAMNSGVKTSNFERIEEMMACPDMVCLTDPIQPMLTGVRSVKLRLPAHSLINFIGIQVYNAYSMLQTLSNAYQTYNCFDHKYYPPTDVILLNFHNYKDKRGSTEIAWKGVLLTPVAFRDFQLNFCDGPSNRAQKKETETERVKRSDEQKGRRPNENCMPVEENEFLLPNSIKNDELLAKMAAELKEKEDAEPKEVVVKGKGKGKGGKKDAKGTGSKDKIAKETGTKKGEAKVKDKSSKTTKGKDDKSSKTVKGKEDKSSKNKKQKGGEDKAENLDKKEEVEIELPIVKRLSLRCAKDDEEYLRIGYDMGPLRIEANGVSKRFYSIDGTEVRVDQHNWLYGTKSLSIQLIKRKHVLTFHSLIGLNQPLVQQPLAFHVKSAFGAILAFGKRTRAPKQMPVVIESPEKVEEKVTKGKKNKNQPKTQKSTLPNKPMSTLLPEPRQVDETETAPDTLPEEPAFPWEYEFRASWPSGLLAETVVGTVKRDPFHVKQHYLQKGPHCDGVADEDYRLFLNNGTVLKFMTDGSVKVLNHDSTVVDCKRFSKPVERRDSFVVPEFRFSTAAVPTTAGGENGDPDAEKTAEECYENPATPPQRASPPVPPPPPPLMQIDDYNVILPSGRQFSFVDDALDAAHEGFMLRTATDLFLGEVYMRRGDGTNTLLKYVDGSLTTTYPDETRITSWYATDQEPARAEWTEEEKAAITAQVAERRAAERIEEKLARRATETPSETNARLKRAKRYRSESMEGYDDDEDSLGESSAGSLSVESGSSGTQGSETSVTSDVEDSSQVDLQPDGENNSETSTGGVELKPRRKKKRVKDLFADNPFVLVHFNCRLEHPNYATVAYLGEDRSAVLEMPHRLKVKISDHGTYTVHMDNRTFLTVQKDLIHYFCQPCSHCEVMSDSIINLSGFGPTDSSTVLCYSTDSWGETVKVGYDGTCRVSDDTDDSTSDTPAAEGQSRRSISSRNTHCLPRKLSHRPRVFALHRDLTGEEFVHMDDYQRHLAATRATVHAVAVCDQIPNESNLVYHTTLTPVRHTASDIWLMHHHKWDDAALPTAMRRRDLRSTYGEPPSWFHPFPLGRGVTQTAAATAARKNASGDGLPATELPKAYIMRIIQVMEPFEGGQNPIASIQEGLIRYWTAAAEKYKLYVEQPIADTRTSKEKEVEEKLLNMALGLTRVVPTELLRRVQLKADAKSDKSSDKSSTHRSQAEELSHVEKQLKMHSAYMEQFKLQCLKSGIEREDLKRLLRTHTVTPYFKTKAGLSFLKNLKSLQHVPTKNAESGLNAESGKTPWECPCTDAHHCKARKCDGIHKPGFFESVGETPS